MSDVPDMVRVGFVPAPGEPAVGSREASASFHEIDAAFAAHGMQPRTRMYFRDSIQASVSHLGEYAVPLAQLLVPAFTIIVVTWLKGRAGRKVRLAVGDTRIEANTAEEVAALIDKAKELQQAKTRAVAKGK